MKMAKLAMFTSGIALGIAAVDLISFLGHPPKNIDGLPGLIGWGTIMLICGIKWKD